jgi:hypothetical protein
MQIKTPTCESALPRFGSYAAVKMIIVVKITVVVKNHSHQKNQKNHSSDAEYPARRPKTAPEVSPEPPG